MTYLDLVKQAVPDLTQNGADAHLRATSPPTREHIAGPGTRATRPQRHARLHRGPTDQDWWQAAHRGAGRPRAEADRRGTGPADAVRPTPPTEAARRRGRRDRQGQRDGRARGPAARPRRRRSGHLQRTRRRRPDHGRLRADLADRRPSEADSVFAHTRSRPAAGATSKRAKFSTAPDPGRAYRKIEVQVSSRFRTPTHRAAQRSPEGAFDCPQRRLPPNPAATDFETSSNIAARWKAFNDLAFK